MPHAERVFLDANVLFSAAIGGTVCGALFRLLGIVLITSDYCVAEAERNLLAKGHDSIAALRTLLEDVEICPTPPPSAWAEVARWLPASAKTDVPILAAAKAAHARVLVTGNTRDFRGLMDSHPEGCPKVLTPRAFLGRGPAEQP